MSPKVGMLYLAHKACRPRAFWNGIRSTDFRRPRNMVRTASTTLAWTKPMSRLAAPVSGFFCRGAGYHSACHSW